MKPTTDTTTYRLGALCTSLFLASCVNPDATSHRTATTNNPTVDCAQLATQFTSPGTRITSTELIPAGLVVPNMAQAYPMPAHCKVTGKMNERTGVDGKAYAIGFEMRLPTNWSGRFLFQANGGSDGVVQPAYGNVVNSGATTNALMQGFAVLSSDAGHATEPGSAKGAGNNAVAGIVGGSLFGLDPQARLDYGYTANGALAPMAKKLIATHYGKAPKTSYMMGCSNGGRHAMVAASRYADQFDGIIAGDPGFNLPKAAVQHAWDIQALTSVNANIKAAFSPADMKLVADKVLEKCDALDGVQDGLVNNLAACQKVFDINALQCTGDKTAQCLSTPQVSALRRMFAGPTNSKGERLYSDWPWDAGVGASQIGFGSWRSWKIEGPVAGLPIIGALGSGSLAYTFTTPPTLVDGTPPALIDYLLKFNFDSDAPKIFATDGPYKESSISFMTPPHASDLSQFQSKGGKLLVYHGNSDPVFSVNDTIAWYEALRQKHGAATPEFARLFTVPGMNHCQGGASTEQFDMLSAMVNWVENKQAPAQILATARVGINPDVPASWKTAAGLPRTRPLCPYPQIAQYKGTGDIELADSFSCRAPH